MIIVQLKGILIWISNNVFYIYTITAGRLFLEPKIYKMKRRIVRNDLVSVSEYSKRYNVNRVKIYQLINDGKLVVEHISGTDYIQLKFDKVI